MNDRVYIWDCGSDNCLGNHSEVGYGGRVLTGLKCLRFDIAAALVVAFKVFQ